MRTARVVVVLVAVLLGAVWVFAKLTSDEGAVSQAFGDGLRAFQTSASSKVRLSPDGTRLAFVQDGSLTVIRIRDAAVLTRAGDNVVDAAWMPDGDGVLVVEGPIPTGEVDVVNAKGRVSGVAQLKPSIGFGNGAGLAVNSSGTKAAAIAITEEAIGGRKRADLAIIDLQSGAVQRYPTGGEESQPVFVDDSTVALAIANPGSTNDHLLVIDLVSGQKSDFGVIYDGPFVATPAREVVVAHRAANAMIRLDAVDPQNGKHRQVAVLRPHRRPVAVDARLTRAVVRVFGGERGERVAVDPLN